MITDGDVRILALWRDDPTEAPMTLDLRLKEGRCGAIWDLFGAFDLNGRGTRPFILRRDGYIDFGTAGPDEWRTDLRDTEMRVGSLFTIWFNAHDSGHYKIVKIASPGSREKV